MTGISTAVLSSLLVVATSSMHTEHPSPKAQAFPLSDVRVTSGLFATANKATAAYLLTVEPERLLHSFYLHSGLPAKGEIYGGWENSGLAGHSLGHYLTACAQEFVDTGDARYKQKVDEIVAGLVACQKSRPDGYISAIPDGDKHWAEIKAGNIRSSGFDLNGMWSPWYTHHKVLAGLIDAHELLGDKDALQVAVNFADWMIAETAGLTEEQWQKMLACEYGGMNDSLAELYAITKQTKYLDLSKKFYDHAVLAPLAEGHDDLSGKHSNTQIPKIIGLARLYELTSSDVDRKTAEFFWDRIVNHRSYVIGGNSNHEILGPADELSDRLSSNTCESCNTYNMLKLTRHLFEWNPDAKYFDYYERAHFNHILGQQDPADGMVTYFIPLASGFARQYSNPFDDWTCCHGTGMESQTKHGDSVYFHNGATRLYVTQFIPTELKWEEAGISLKQTTSFPSSGEVSLEIEKGHHRFELDIRHPWWAKSAFDIRVNGKVVARSSTPSSFVTVDRTWKEGDKVEFSLPLSLYTESTPDNPKRQAVLYGPIVLSADLGSADAPAPTIPVLVTGEAPPSEWLTAGAEPLEFKTKGVARPEELTFRPFFAMHHNRYATYFDEFTEPQWEQKQAEYRAEEVRLKDLQARTVDLVRIGEMQPERDHNLKAERCDVRDANGRGFRTAMTNGWFEFDMKVDPAHANELVVTYWGNERLKPHFQILIDGKLLSEETLPDRKNNVFFDVERSIPQEMTQGKSTVRVRIQPVGTAWAMSIAGARMARK